MQLFARVKERKQGYWSSPFVYGGENLRAEGSYLTGDFSGGFGMLDFNGIRS